MNKFLWKNIGASKTIHKFLILAIAQLSKDSLEIVTIW